MQEDRWADEAGYDPLHDLNRMLDIVELHDPRRRSVGPGELRPIAVQPDHEDLGANWTLYAQARVLGHEPKASIAECGERRSHQAISDTLAVAKGSEAAAMKQPSRPPLLDIQFRLGGAGSDSRVEVSLSSFGDRWMAVATIADTSHHGLGRNAREALVGALASLGQPAVTALLADVALLAPSLEIARQERALGA